jgi:hypothetical protein
MDPMDPPHNSSPNPRCGRLTKSLLLNPWPNFFHYTKGRWNLAIWISNGSTSPTAKCTTRSLGNALPGGTQTKRKSDDFPRIRPYASQTHQLAQLWHKASSRHLLHSSQLLPAKLPNASPTAAGRLLPSDCPAERNSSTGHGGILMSRFVLPHMVYTWSIL